MAITKLHKIWNVLDERFRKIKESREEIGQAGESWVVNHERKYLIGKGKNDLAERITRVSEINIGAGYDVLSLEINESE